MVAEGDNEFYSGYIKFEDGHVTSPAGDIGAVVKCPPLVKTYIWVTTLDVLSHSTKGNL